MNIATLIAVYSQCLLFGIVQIYLASAQTDFAASLHMLPVVFIKASSGLWIGSVLGTFIFGSLVPIIGGGRLSMLASLVALINVGIMMIIGINPDFLYIYEFVWGFSLAAYYPIAIATLLNLFNSRFKAYLVGSVLLLTSIGSASQPIISMIGLYYGNFAINLIFTCLLLISITSLIFGGATIDKASKSTEKTNPLLSIVRQIQLIIQPMVFSLIILNAGIFIFTGVLMPFTLPKLIQTSLGNGYTWILTIAILCSALGYVTAGLFYNKRWALTMIVGQGILMIICSLCFTYIPPKAFNVSGLLILCCLTSYTVGINCTFVGSYLSELCRARDLANLMTAFTWGSRVIYALFSAFSSFIVSQTSTESGINFTETFMHMSIIYCVLLIVLLLTISAQRLVIKKQ